MCVARHAQIIQINKFAISLQTLKLVSAIFYQIFIFSSNDSPLKTEKYFLFHLKSSFVLEILNFF